MKIQKKKIFLNSVAIKKEELNSDSKLIGINNGFYKKKDGRIRRFTEYFYINNNNKNENTSNK